MRSFHRSRRKPTIPGAALLILALYCSASFVWPHWIWLYEKDTRLIGCGIARGCITWASIVSANPKAELHLPTRSWFGYNDDPLDHRVSGWCVFVGRKRSGRQYCFGTYIPSSIWQYVYSYRKSSEGFVSCTTYQSSIFVIIGIVLLPTGASLYHLIRRRFRFKHGLCIHCGYNLMGLLSARCPECGAPFSQPNAK